MDEQLLQNSVARSARRCPDRIAVEDGSHSLTYRLLDRLSDRISLQLAASGVTRGTAVGVYLQKSVEAVAAFLGILKAGGVYIPLDAHYSPPERIRTILSLSGTTVLVTDTRHLKKLSEGAPVSSSVTALFLTDALTDTSFDGFSERQPSRITVLDPLYRTPEEPPSVTRSQDDLAYILYTSGSTGIPKGVMISHRNALTFIDWAADAFTFTDGTVFASHAPFHFDLSVFDLYVCFAAGGTVKLIPPNIMANPRALADWIAENGINVWYSVPSVWVTMFTYARLDTVDFSRLHTILFAGEVFPPRFLRQLMETFPGKRYFNLYGPTETNVCTWYEALPEHITGEEPLPIGCACRNTTVMAADETHREVDIGEEGELLVSGPIVAAGYYRDRERTDASFVTLTDQDGTAQRWYTTGDIVQRISADSYRYIGRKDLMVKCSGFRIELQEIERVLLRHPDIREAVVVAFYREERGSTVLTACCTLNEGVEPSVSSIRAWCAGSLPHYMIPETVFFHDELPRNTNGKIDRQLLTVRPQPVRHTSMEVS